MIKRILIAPFALASYAFGLFLKAVDEQEKAIADRARKHRDKRQAAAMMHLDPAQLEKSGKLEDTILARQVRILRSENASSHQDSRYSVAPRTTGSGDKPPPPRR